VGKEGKVILPLNPSNQFQGGMSIESFQWQHRPEQRPKLR
jgi:hypothetical protein